MDYILAPPSNAVKLFNEKDLSNWTTRSGDKAGWEAKDGIMHVVPSKGDIMTKERFTDFYLHLEWMEPDMPDAKGQAKGNSGVFLQGRYEIQVLDSYGIPVPGKGDCGAVYNQYATLVNACKPPLQWQSYDIIFRAPRMGADGKLENARVTAFQNGMVIHNNIILEGFTGGNIEDKVLEPGPLLLQDHGNLLKYRNIWVVELPLKGSDQY
ncbi:MAG: hypothetical protein QG641_873 [Candidatus Poribacteria bacterium]|nr:hypothetical protein [Candidatus Poribacteria bacterium]